MSAIRCTIFTPHWGATPELHTFAEARRKCSDREMLKGRFRGLPVRFSRTEGSEVIQLDQRIATMPEGLKDIPMASIKMVERNTDASSIPRIHDGAYAEGDIVGRIDTHYEADKLVRIYRVNGGKNATVEEVNAWLDALIEGMKPRADLLVAA